MVEINPAIKVALRQLESELIEAKGQPGPVIKDLTKLVMNELKFLNATKEELSVIKAEVSKAHDADGKLQSLIAVINNLLNDKPIISKEKPTSSPLQTPILSPESIGISSLKAVKEIESPKGAAPHQMENLVDLYLDRKLNQKAHNGAELKATSHNSLAKLFDDPDNKTVWEKTLLKKFTAKAGQTHKLRLNEQGILKIRKRAAISTKKESEIFLKTCKHIKKIMDQNPGIKWPQTKENEKAQTLKTE